MDQVFQCDCCLNAGGTVLNIGCLTLIEHGGENEKLEICRSCYRLLKRSLQQTVDASRVREMSAG